MASPFRSRILRPVQEFLQTEAAGGLVLLGAAGAALLLANLPVSGTYHDVLEHDLTLGIGDGSITESLGGWISDGLMAFFFFVVGLEIKRELVEGELRDPKTAALPVLAAVGGMAVPALLYAVVNVGEPSLRGWGIPLATDIAFAVGLITLLGEKVPPSVKVFLLTLAIADDVGGILVIAFFYTESFSGPWLAGAAAGVLAVWTMQRLGVRTVAPYVVVAAWTWVAAHESGVHPTIAGVALALAMRPSSELEHRLHPWSSYLVVPLFALASAGIELDAGALGDAFTAPVTWGVILGLVVGKTLGIAAAVGLAVRARVGRLPAGMEGRHVVGVGMVAGIGFTVALFIADLSFADRPALLEHAKVGVLFASFVAAALGAGWLTRTATRR